jgi:HAMP domain-containing protein
MQLQRLGIRWRIYAGFGSLLALGLGLAGIALWALFSVNRDVTQMDAAADHAAVLQGVLRDMIVMRTKVERDSFGEEDSAIARKVSQDAAQRLKTATATRSPERRKVYEGLIQGVSTYENERNEWAGLSAQLQAEIKKLFADGDELTAASERLRATIRAGTDRSILGRAAEVETTTLLVRVANWQFFATFEPQGPEVFKANVERARAALADLEAASSAPDVRAQIGSMKTVLDRYAASFAVASADTLRINELHTNLMVPRLNRVQTQIDSDEGRLRSEFADVRNTATATIKTATTVQEAVAALGLLLGGLCAFFLARSIIRPVAEMTYTMGKLAGGDTEAEIPGRDALDEIGEMARAVEVFRQNAIARSPRGPDERPPRRRRTFVRNAAARRRVRARDRRDRAHRVDGRLGARILGKRPLPHRGRDPGTVRQCGERLGAGLRHGRGGRGRGRAARGLGRRDRPAGAGIEPDRCRGGAAGGRD